ncbi:hypothetical protein HMPREF0080_00706 [Anaeroglobus geminatus F0357]|uniref:Uncharacterized protein n=1 Tax=Anaeroglobus geminatus F0357 TaxID=861450 RepID=G9YGE2_9FIRM|nr:hypothetical protein HMPREF0080_00706 [Anaeroglobus geminatus F0357]
MRGILISVNYFSPPFPDVYYGRIVIKYPKGGMPFGYYHFPSL